jgi:inorganic triphosphatase YgiF
VAEELEFKLLVGGPAELEAVARAAEARGARRGPTHLQRNHFLDTQAGGLRARGALVRLREEAGRWTLTAKGPGESRAELHRRLELEADVGAAAAAGVLSGERDALDELECALGGDPFLAELRGARGGARLVLLGTLENERTRVGPLRVEGRAMGRAGEGEVWLELDRARFPGGEPQCEVELEVPPGLEVEARALLDELFADAGVRGAPAPSKAERFLGKPVQGRGRGDRP